MQCWALAAFLLIGLGEDRPASVGSEKTEHSMALEAPSTRTATSVETTLRLRTLEEEVSSLRQRIFQSKARLLLLRETVLSGAIGGAKALIVHSNEMGSSFVLRRASYSLDGEPIFNENDSGDTLDDRLKIELFEGSIVPGNHNISVVLEYQGSGYGIFQYLEGYKYKIKSSYAFTAEEGKTISLKVVAYEKGGFTTDIRERPAIRYDVQVQKDQPEPASDLRAAKE